MTKKKMKNWFLTGGNLRKKHKRKKNLNKLVCREDGKKCDLQYAKERLKFAKGLSIKERK
jgi:hypothetical protein